MTTTSSPRPQIDFSGLSSFFRHDANIVCAYVFGSARDGDIREGSDLDLAVLFSSPPQDSRSEFEYYSVVCEAVGRITDRIDLVILNRADPILAYEALRGRKLCDNSPEETAGFNSLVAREYEDVMADIERQRRHRKELSLGQ